MNEKGGVGKVVMKGLNEKGGEEKRKGIHMSGEEGI